MTTEATALAAVEQPPDTDEWMELTAAADEFGIRRDTLITRIVGGKFAELDFKKVPFGAKGKYLVRRSAMAAQPPVQSKFSATGPRPKAEATPAKPRAKPAADISHHIAYCGGYLTAWLDMYARGQQLSEGELRAGVMSLLKGDN